MAAAVTAVAGAEAGVGEAGRSRNPRDAVGVEDFIADRFQRAAKVVHQRNSLPHLGKKNPVAGRGREPSHRERWVAAKFSLLAASAPNREPAFSSCSPLVNLQAGRSAISDCRAKRQKPRKIPLKR